MTPDEVTFNTVFMKILQAETLRPFTAWKKYNYVAALFKSKYVKPFPRC